MSIHIRDEAPTRPGSPVETSFSEKILCLDKIQRPELRQWYQPGQDLCYYQDAIVRAKEITRSLKPELLPPEDRADFENDLGKAAVMKFFHRQERFKDEERQKEIRSKEGKILFTDIGKKAVDVFVRFFEMIEPILDVVVPSTPEYAVPYGCLKLIFKFISKHKDQKAEISNYFEALNNILPDLDFYTKAVPTNAMKSLLAQIYVHILNFLERIWDYSVLKGWAKLRNSLRLKPKEIYDFENLISQIKEVKKELESLARKRDEALRIETQEMGKATAAGIRELYILSRDANSAAKDASSAASSNIALLQQRLVDLQRETQIWTNAQACATSYQLLSILFDDNNDDQDLGTWQAVKFRLASKDHWEVNGVLDRVAQWSDAPVHMNSIFMTCGPFGSKDSWVTYFARDLIRLLRAQEVKMTFAFCDQQEGRTLTPTQLLKRLVGQLLEQNPTLVLEEPRLFNVRVFQRTSSFNAVWEIFAKVIAKEQQSVFIVIDRIDCCTGRRIEDIGTGHELLSRLSELVFLSNGTLRVIITTAEPVPEQLREELKFSYFELNTQAPPRRREWDFGSINEGRGIAYYESMAKHWREEAIYCEEAIKRREAHGRKPAKIQVKYRYQALSQMNMFNRLVEYALLDQSVHIWLV